MTTYTAEPTAGGVPQGETNDFSLTATDILEHLYCPRFSFFEIYLGIPEHQEKRFKVQKGRMVHDEKIAVNPTYLRKKLGCIERRKSVYLAAGGMRGVVDEVLFLRDGTAAPLDYKYAEYKDRTFKNHRYQLAFYGRLIQKCFDLPVPRGLIVYTRSRNKLVEVELTAAVYADLDKIVSEFLEIVQKGLYPKPTRYPTRCADCCYRNICEKVV